MRMPSSRALLAGALVLFLPILSLAQVARVRHAPTLNGNVEGSIQQMTGEAVTLNGGANVTGDLLVPGSPTIRLNGQPNYGGTQDGSGSASPSNYQITLNGNAALRNVVRRTDPVTLPTIGAPTAPTGTVNLSPTAPNQTINWATLRNLTLNGSAGYYTVPAGNYGQFTANNGNGFILGVAGATQPSVYNFQSFAFNSGSQLRVIGPVIVNVAAGPSLNGSSYGASDHPNWLTLNIQSGNVSLNGNSTVYGALVAPASTVTLNGNSLLDGALTCDRLTVNGNSTLRLVAPPTGNQAPVVSLTAPATGSSFTAPASIAFAATATDSDGSIAKVEFFQGAVSLGVDTTAPYTMTLNAIGAGNYSYYARATDNLGASSDSATVTVTVTNPNVPPTVSLTAPADGSSASAPATLTLAATAADTDGSIAKVEFYQGATKLGEDTSAPYQQVTGSLAAGTYEFSAKAFDNGGASTVSTVITITVVTPNQPPVVSITAPLDGTSFDDPATFILKATASDPNGTVTKVEFFKEGVLLGEDIVAPYEFTVSGLAIGAYDFVARATDNAGSSTDSTAVRLTVTHFNDAPTAAAQSPTTSEETPITITLTGADPDGDVISFIRTSEPSHGTLTQVSSAVFTYTPALDYNGADSFTFKVSDGILESAPAAVQITVTPRNDPPIIIPPQPVTVPENGSVSILLGASDVDGPSLNFGVTANVSHGTLSGTMPNPVYTPATGYSGPDSFTYVVSDGEFFSAPAVVNITVTPGIPVVNSPLQTAGQVGVAFNYQITATNSPTSFSASGLPAGLMVNAATGLISGTPTAAAAGSVTISATNAAGIGTAVLTLAINQPPTVTLTAPVSEGSFIAPASITLVATATDIDGSVTKVEFFQNDTLIGESQTEPYQLVWQGVLSGSYTLTARATDDRNAISDSVPVSIAVNTRPVANAQNIVINEDISKEITMTGSDIENGLLLYSIYDLPNHGSITPTSSPSTFTYTPEANYSGSDSFTFRVSDGELLSTPAAVNLTITPVNDAPVANALTLSVNEDSAVAIKLTGSDSDSEALTFAKATDPAHGSLYGTAPNLTYVPNPGYHGPDSFTYTASDGQLSSSPGDVVITVEPHPIVITTPVNGLLANAPVVHVTGTTAKPMASVKVNNVAAMLSGDGLSFSADVPVTEGANTITAVAFNAQGESVVANVNVTRDTESPRIAIDTPVTGRMVGQDHIAVTGIINDTVIGTVNSSQAVVRVNGMPAIVVNRTFIADNVPLVPGANTLTASATDRAGNVGTASITVIYQNAPTPKVQIVSGDEQTARIGSHLPIPLAVLVTDSTGSPVAGKDVIFKVVQNDGQLTGGGRTARSIIVVTDQNGQASVDFQLGTRVGVGNHQVNAMVVGCPIEALFRESATPAPPGLIVSDSGNRQSAAPGQPLANPFVAIVVDEGHNRLGGVPVTFTMMEGGGTFNGLPTKTVVTDSDGRALATLILGAEEGIENNRVEATFENNTKLPVAFVASGLTPGQPSETEVSGVILDNSDVPVPGATVKINGTELTTVSNEQGQFSLKPAPIGTIRLDVYGNTVTRSGSWVNLDFALTTVSGRNNTIGMPIRLLPMELANSVAVGTNYGGTITLPEYPGFSLKLLPGSVTFPGGSKVGSVSVTVVHNDKTPEVPNFGQQPRFIVSINPKRCVFSPAAQMCLPNLDGLPPGKKTEMYSWDDDLNAFVAIGTGTVTEDGTQICTDPGIGVIKGGWHCGGDPSTTAGATKDTVTVDLKTVVVELNKTAVITATGNPAPPAANPFTWTKTFTDIPSEEQGDIQFSPSTDGVISKATITGTKEGKVKLEVTYQCENGERSDPEVVEINVGKVTVRLWETQNKANLVPNNARRDDPIKSSQDPDIEGNQYGIPRNLLYLTADPSDKNYHVSVDIKSKIRDQFVCAAYRGSSKVNGTDKPFPSSADQPANLVIPATGSNQNGEDFVIKVALDTNKNGLLDSSETPVDLGGLVSTFGSAAQPMVRAFSVEAVAAADSIIKGQAFGTGWTGLKPNKVGRFFVPNAIACERLFYTGDAGTLDIDYRPTSELHPDASLNVFGPPVDFNEWLTHSAGAAFNADGVTNTIKHYEWNELTPIATMLASSSPFSTLKNREEILSKMQAETNVTVEAFKAAGIPVGQTEIIPNDPNGHDLQTALSTLGKPHWSPSWVPPQTLVIGNEDGYFFGSVPDDANNTLGRSRFTNGRYWFVVKRENRVEHYMTGEPPVTYDMPYKAVVIYLRVSGRSEDIYDFNHNCGGLSIPAAITQLSFGNGGYGRSHGIIYRSSVNIFKEYEIKEIRLP